MKLRPLIDAYRRAVDAREPKARRDCPPPDALRSLIDRVGPDETRLAMLDHVMSCAACAREFELLRAVEDAAPRARPRATWAAALAATILVAAGLQWFTRARTSAAGEDEPIRGASDAVGVVGVVQAGGATQLVWRTVVGAMRYDVELLDAGGEPVYAATVRDTVAALPDSLAAASTAAWRWWVRAHLGDGSTRESPRAPFDRAPGPDAGIAHERQDRPRAR